MKKLLFALTVTLGAACAQEVDLTAAPGSHQISVWAGGKLVLGTQVSQPVTYGDQTWVIVFPRIANIEQGARFYLGAFPSSIPEASIPSSVLVTSQGVIHAQPGAPLWFTLILADGTRIISNSHLMSGNAPSAVKNFNLSKAY